MKLHQNIIDSIVLALKHIFVDGYYADDTVRNLLQSNPKWGSRDRRFIAQALYTIVRWWRRYLYIADTSIEDALCFEKVLTIYLTETYADAVSTLPVALSKENILLRTTQAVGLRAIKESIPDWLDELAEAELGKIVWEKELVFLNKEADVFIRVNAIRKNARQVLAALEKEGIAARPYGTLPETLQLTERKSLVRLASYLNGDYEIQDAGSQLIAHFLHPEKNKNVIDACAGAGGKSLHLAALMENKGQLICMDVELNKLKELERRAQRAGISIIQTKGIKENTIASLHESADYLLLDVPCSGIGVLRRNPDDKWKLTQASIQELIMVQQQIIQNYSGMLKRGGVMVYATCSILPAENEKQIDLFLASNKNFQLEKMQTIFPSEGSDGYFMARFKKY